MARMEPWYGACFLVMQNNVSADYLAAPMRPAKRHARHTHSPSQEWRLWPYTQHGSCNIEVQGGRGWA